MLLKNTSKEFRKSFFLEFTRQLIKATNPSIFFELTEQIKEETLEEKEERAKQDKRIKQLIKDKEKARQPLFSQRKREIPRQRMPRVLTMPKPRLPAHLRYLRPTSTNLQIDLGKLNILIKDRAVQSIECNGPDEKIMVRVPSLKPSTIILSKIEIDEIVNKFSKISKIPSDSGFFRVVVGNLIFSAVVSEMTGSKFIIKKMNSPRRG